MLPKEGINELSKYGFDWIVLKVIVQGPKGQKKVKFGCLATVCQFSQKRSEWSGLAHFPILIDIIQEVLPQCIASCIFSGVKPILS